MTVWLVNGVPGSGKSTVAQTLARRFESGVHIEGDALQAMIVRGGIPPQPTPSAESERQIALCVRNQCLLAESFVEAGFVVVIDYVVTSRARLELYRRHLGNRPLRLITLNPRLDVAAQRDALREAKQVASDWRHLREEIERELADAGLWIDNSELTPDEVVDLILADAPERLRPSPA